jgi:integrase
LSARLAPATVRTNYGVLRAAMNAAGDDGRIARSPCRRITLPRSGDNPRHALEPAELHRLAAAMPREYRAIVYIGGVLGLRWSEIAGLRVGRVNILGCTLEVAEAIKYVNGRLVADGLVKSKASLRVLGLPDELATIIAEHLAHQHLTGADADAFVFASPRGGPLNYQNFMLWIWKLAVTTAGGFVVARLWHAGGTRQRRVGPTKESRMVRDLRLRKVEVMGLEPTTSTLRT